MKKFLAMFAVAILGLFGFVASTFADLYRTASGAVTSVGGAAKDTADSLIWSIGDFLPVLVPLLVVGFIIGIVMSVIRRRG